MQVDWFKLAADIVMPDPEVRLLSELCDPHYVESNENFPVLDEDFDQ